MKKGYLNTADNSEQIPDKNDYIYEVACYGTTEKPAVASKFLALPSTKRGLVHQVYLDPSFRIFDMAAKMEALILEGIGQQHVNNGVPIMIDIWTVPNNDLGTHQMGLDHLITYFDRLTQNIDFIVKPILRLLPSVFSTWSNEHPIETERLLQRCDVLICAPGIQRPPSLPMINRAEWFEYSYGLYAYDETGQWEQSPVTVQPTPEPEPEPEPIDEPETPTPQPTPGNVYDVEIEGTIWFMPVKLRGTFTRRDE